MVIPSLLVWAIAGAALQSDAAPPAAPPSAPPPLAEPTAPTRLRDLTTDRPDTTESPFTVDAGHVQVETTLLGYARAPRDAAGSRAESAEFATTNVRIGLTPALEVDVGLQPFGIVSPGAGLPRSHGIGALDLRAKLNLWGNGGAGRSAFALLPFVSIPIDRGNVIGPADTEYGLLVPLALDLGGALGLGLNGGVTLRRDDPAARYRAYGIATASLAVSWSDAVGSYFEVTGEAGGGESVATSLNTGVTWLVNDNAQFDIGVQFGTSGASPAFAPFIGVTVRR